MDTPITWPLMTSAFNTWDRFKIATWVLTQDKYTMGRRVAEFEAAMEQLAGGTMRAVAVTNGSAANQLVFELWKTKHTAADLKQALVIVPAVTWLSSISTATMAGFKVQFVDVNIDDLAVDYEEVEKVLKGRKGKPTIIWPTSLLGYNPDMPRLRELAARYKADLYLDACENTLSYISPTESILASCDVTTTSTYFGHMLNSVEGGFVFVKDPADYKLARMLRNHGLTRSLAPDDPVRRKIEEGNPSVDPAFLFALNGTNLRLSDVHAMFGLQDVKRAEQYRVHRIEMFNRFADGLNGNWYLPPPNEGHVAFCLPIFLKGHNGCNPVMGGIERVKRELRAAGIEVRPVVGSHLGYQPALKHWFKQPVDKHYPNADWIHHQGAYVGIHGGVTAAMVDDLTDLLNSL